MGRLQTIISNGSGSRGADMDNGSPSFQLVVAGSMKDVSRADRNSRARRLDRGKCRMIIHSVVGQKDLLPPTPSHVQGRKVVQRSRSARAGEQPRIGPVPELVFVRFLGGNCGRVLLRSRRHRHVLCPTNGQHKCREAECKSD